jgi:hypothetical protein
MSICVRDADQPLNLRETLSRNFWAFSVFSSTDLWMKSAVFSAMNWLYRVYRKSFIRFYKQATIKLMPHRELCMLHYWARTLEMPTVLCRTVAIFKHLKTKHRLLYLKTQYVPRSKHFHLGYKNQSVYNVSGTSRCLFSDNYKTHKYSVGRKYNCWMLNLLVHHVTSRL